jgi:hypothetical protein
VVVAVEVQVHQQVLAVAVLAVCKLALAQQLTQILFMLLP